MSRAPDAAEWTDCPLSPQSVPALPAVDELEALLATGTASLQAAWAITCRDIDHALSVVARRDARTGQLLPQPLSELLSAMAGMEAECMLPHDILHVAAVFSADSLVRLLGQHRQQTRRHHELMPLHALREVDSRCNAWLARQPGRNVREKLAGRAQVMGVRRQLSADIRENRLLSDLARLLGRRLHARLALVNTPSAKGDHARWHELEEIRALCEERFRRSELAELPPLSHFRPNNVLLSDPDYSRLYRAWRWLRHESDSRAGGWAPAPQRSVTLLFWLLASRLSARVAAIIPESVARVVLEPHGSSDVGLEVWSGIGDRPHWQLNPPLQFQISVKRSTPLQVRLVLLLEGQDIILRFVGMADASGALSSEILLSLACCDSQPSPGRGIPMRVECRQFAPRSGGTVHADLQGLMGLAEDLTQHVLSQCQANAAVRRPRPSSRHPDIIAPPLLGMAFGNGTIRLKDSQQLSAAAPGWAAAFQLPEDGNHAEWIDGADLRTVVAGERHRQLWSSGDILAPDEQADFGRGGLAARQMMLGLLRRYELNAHSAVAYAVPDAIDEISQGIIRSAIGHAFTRGYPVWRSVAAAVGWTLYGGAGECNVAPGDQVVVVDAEFPEVSLTVLMARHDAALERKFPASKGIGWERKPALAADESLEMLGWPHIVEAYAKHILSGALRRPLESERDFRILDDLVRTGVIRELIRDNRDKVVTVSSGSCAGAELLRIAPDADWLGRETAAWMVKLAAGTKEQLHGMGKGGRRHVLLVGGPSHLPPLPGPERMFGTLKMFNKEKKYGFIRSRDDGRDIFLPPGALTTGLEPLLQPGMALEFEVINGSKGPQARLVSADQGLQHWTHLQIKPLAAEALASGALECLSRITAGCSPWREWLPSLSLEVIRDGHFGEIRLLDGTQSVTPFLGKQNSFDVPGILTLAAGQPWFSFPLMIGKEGQRPLSWEARLESQAFPLTSDMTVRLQLSYQYGLEQSYRLFVIPADSSDARLSPIEARWTRGASSVPRTKHATPTSLETLEAGWPERVVKDLHFAASSMEGALTDDQMEKSVLPYVRRIWADGRRIASAPDEVREVARRLREKLRQSVPNDLSPSRIPVALRILALMHVDAPAEVAERIYQLDSEAGDDKDMSAPVVRLIKDMVGDASGDRRRALECLMNRMLRATAPSTFNPALARQVLQGLSMAAWRDRRLVAALTDMEVVTVVSRIQRNLVALLARVPVTELPSDAKETLLKRYGYPFRDMCQLLLALVWLRPQTPVAQLTSGSPTAEMVAKVIRQLDARFSQHQIDLGWQQGSTIEVPAELHRMSRVVYALNKALASSQSTNLAQVSEVERAG